jgi:hypothetical protein
MKNLKDFSSSCFNLCIDGFITIEALSNAAGFSSSSYASTAAPPAAPQPEPSPSPVPRRQKSVTNRKVPSGQE